MARTIGPDLEKAALVDRTVDEMTQRGIEAVISVRQATLSLAPSGRDFTFDPYGIAHVISVEARQAANGLLRNFESRNP